MALLLFAIIILVFCCYCIYYKKSQKQLEYLRQYGIRSNSKSWSIFKTFFTRNYVFLDSVKEIYNAMPDKLHVDTVNGFQVLVVKDPKLIEVILLKNFECFKDHSNFFFNQDLDPFMSKVLFTLKGKDWHDMRSILSPAFTSSKMRTMLKLMIECGLEMGEYFQIKNETDKNEIVEIDFSDVSSRFSNDVIATTAFGIKINSFCDLDNAFYKMGKELGNLSTHRIILQILAPKLCKLLNIQMVSPKITNYFEQVITETITYRRKENISRSDMLQLLLETKQDWTVRDIAAQAFIFFLAGGDTTATAMCFVIYELVRNSEIQEKLYQEIKLSCAKNNNQITYDSLKDMTYLDMVISETLRLWPIAPVLDRVCTNTISVNLETGRDLVIEKGTQIQIPLAGLHYDPMYFNNPETFDPERFCKNRKSNSMSYTYLPFGFGPRNCIGLRFAYLEIKVFICHVLIMYELIPTSKTEIPIKLEPNNTNTKPRSQVWIGLKRRLKENISLN